MKIAFCRLSVVFAFSALGTVWARDKVDSLGTIAGMNESRTQTGENEYEAIARLTGEDDPENIDAQTFEQLSWFYSHPIPVNSSSRSRLLASGLFTAYQVATLIDYRERCGDILSCVELALIDGFSAETASALAPFITLRKDSSAGRSGKSPGGIHKFHFRNSVRVPLPEEGNSSPGPSQSSGERINPEITYGMKYRLSCPGGIEVGIGLNRGYADKAFWPAGGTFFLAYYGRNHLGKVVIGDYSIRFGQGLAVWTGFNMSSISFPESFYRRSYGISPCISYSTGSSVKGVAADFIFGKFTLALSMGLDGFDKALSKKLSGKDFPVESLSFRPCANLAWTARNITASVTLTAGTGPMGRGGRTGQFSDLIVSGDCRCCVRGVDLFSEVVCNAIRQEASAIAGAVFRPKNLLEIGLCAKYLKDTYTAVVGGRFSVGRKVSIAGKSGFGSIEARHSGNFTLESDWYDYRKFKGTTRGGQIRLIFNYYFRLNPFISLDFRLSQRNRTAGERNRSELRTRFVWTDGIWRASTVADVVHCSDFGVLGYAEGGHSAGRFSCFLRAGAFRIDNWSDRIYVYERDMPDNFNVPAFRGRGCWVSAYCYFKLSRGIKLFLRSGYTGYPFEEMQQKNFRPGRTEVKVGAVLELRSRESSIPSRD